MKKIYLIIILIAILSVPIYFMYINVSTVTAFKKSGAKIMNEKLIQNGNIKDYECNLFIPESQISNNTIYHDFLYVIKGHRYNNVTINIWNADNISTNTQDLEKNSEHLVGWYDSNSDLFQTMPKYSYLQNFKYKTGPQISTYTPAFK